MVGQINRWNDADGRQVDKHTDEHTNGPTDRRKDGQMTWICRWMGRQPYGQKVSFTGKQMGK